MITIMFRTLEMLAKKRGLFFHGIKREVSQKDLLQRSDLAEFVKSWEMISRERAMGKVDFKDL